MGSTSKTSDEKPPIDDWRELRHSIGTHLNSISGYCQLLLTGSYDPLSDKQTDVVEKVLKNCRDISRLLDEMRHGPKSKIG